MPAPRRPRASAQERARAALDTKAKYDAAGMGRRMRGWNPPSSGPNRAIMGLQKLRDRSRDSVRNDWASHGGVQRWVTNLIGIGIIPRFRRISNKKRRQQLVDLLADWVKVSDADGVLTYYGQQTMVTRAWLESGEVFIRRRDRDPADDLPVPLQLQVVEADFVPLIDFDQDPRLPVGNRVRQGIELDRRGRRIAYWMHREHPGDPTQEVSDRSRLLRIAADQVIHLYEPPRPGALRGVSMLAPVLARLRNIADYDDAVLERQKLANLFMAFIKKVLPTDHTEDINPLTGLPNVWDSASDEPLAPMAAGTVHELLPGEEVQFANPPEAGTTFSDYMRTQQLGTAAGQDMPYELLAGDIKDVSDRTLRIIINEFRRLAEQRQWQIIIPMFCQRSLEWFADAATLVNKVSIAELDDVKRVEWAPHGWAYIHPTQDAQGKQIEVDAGFRSRASVIAERGDDPEQVDEERASDKKREDDLGLTPPPPAPAGGPQPGEKKQGNDQPPPKALLDLTSAISRVEGLVQAREPAAAPLAPNVTVNAHIAAPAAPNVEVHNEVPVPAVNVAAPTVEVHNEVPAPVVNVAAPNIAVQAPNVEVRNEVPAVQQIEITAMPTRETTTAVKRDGNGNITKTTQTESDAEPESK